MKRKVGEEHKGTVPEFKDPVVDVGLFEAFQKPFQTDQDALSVRLAQCDYHNTVVILLKVGDCMEEISVCGEEYGALLLGQMKDCNVLSAFFVGSADINKFMPTRHEQRSGALGEVFVEEEPHGKAVS